MKKNILFLCVANSARSQMAEGLSGVVLEEIATTMSAGSNPSGIVHPNAIKVLKEIGIDISKNFSKSIDELPKEFLDQLDYSITLCADEICPTINSKCQKLHWPIPDPVNEEGFRLARELIRKKIINFKKQLTSN